MSLRTTEGNASDFAALRARIARGECAPEALGAAHEAHLAGRADAQRRRTGAHYTPLAIAREVVAKCLAPRLAHATTPEALLALRVCDPAMGGGYFLLAACRALAAHLTALWGRPSRYAEALSRVARECLYGLDLDPQAVRVARESLALLTGSHDPDALRHRLCLGDALVHHPRVSARVSLAPFVITEAFFEVFDRDNPGFDAVVGNPPWIAHAGRAAQPVAPARRRWLLEHNAAFHGYRSAHGLFIRRAAEILRRGGRLGFVVPTSVSDLAGYAPTRAAHDALCECDPSLPDFGSDAFEGVFQPAMALLSTRRPRDRRPPDALWTLIRDDLSPEDRALIERLSKLPPMPPELFRERGFHTQASDKAHMHPAGSRRGLVALREGADITAFLRRKPRVGIDVDASQAKLGARGRWREVAVLVRQTARVPIAAASDGGAFRNSLLAVIACEGYPRGLLLAWLNSGPLRWLHYMRQRDARQGMPQVKISHLRALPAPLGPTEALEALGEYLAIRNTGISVSEQRNLDGLVGRALGLTNAEREHIGRWSAGFKV